MSWSDNFWVLDAVAYQTTFPTNGYTNGMVSSPNVAYNRFENDVSFSSSSPFTLNSFYLTASWNTGLNVEIDAYLGGTLVHSLTAIVDTSGPTLFSPDWTGIDTVTFHAFGGDDANLGGSGKFFALDNLNVTAVPGPIAGAGLPGLRTPPCCAWRFRSGHRASGHSCLVVVMRDTNEFFEGKARECTALAQAAGHETDRDFWLRLARRWQEMQRPRRRKGTQSEGGPPRRKYGLGRYTNGILALDTELCGAHGVSEPARQFQNVAP